VLYTDGLVEQRDELIDRGIERPGARAGHRRPAEPERLCERIIRRTVGSDHPHDDVTLVVVRRR
jgi:serine phosphatase RsbU (regulator of sigma subunit)